MGYGAEYGTALTPKCPVNLSLRPVFVPCRAKTIHLMTLGSSFPARPLSSVAGGADRGAEKDWLLTASNYQLRPFRSVKKQQTRTRDYRFGTPVRILLLKVADKGNNDEQKLSNTREPNIFPSTDGGSRSVEVLYRAQIAVYSSGRTVHISVLFPIQLPF